MCSHLTAIISLVFRRYWITCAVNGQFPPLEVTGSGDGLNENSTYSRLPLIDDNGDISTAVTGVHAIKNLEETVDNFTDTTLFSTDFTAEETTVKFLVNDSFTDTTMTQNLQTTIFTTALPTTDQEATNTLVDSTTTSLLTMSSTTETTTTVDTTTTEEESATTESITTSTTVKTTKKPIKTDTATETPEVEHKTKLDTTVAKVPPTSAPASTVSMAEDAGKRCLFMDTGLNCDVEVVCYGDGEIDCTDDEEMDADEADFVDDIPSPLDDSDYISEGDTSETVPWGRSDSNSHRLNLFKMFPLIPTNNEDSSEKDMTTTLTPSFNFTMPANEELLAEENSKMDTTTNADDAENVQDSEVMEGLDGFLPPTESTEALKIYDDVKISSSTDNSSNTDFPEDLDSMLLGNGEIMTTSFPNASEIQIPSKINETIIYEEGTNNETSTEVTATNTDLTTSDALDKILLENVTEKDNKDQDVIARAKRDNSANSSNGYHISNYKVSELESSKKKLKVRSCKLSGNLMCIPRPTKSSCSGKTLCQVPPQAIETVEKPATQKGLEKWTIAVIVICAITATFTIALLIYLVFTSYKKLKVQPQNGVTTLNYINSTQP